MSVSNADRGTVNPSYAQGLLQRIENVVRAGRALHGMLSLMDKVGDQYELDDDETALVKEVSGDVYSIVCELNGVAGFPISDATVALACGISAVAERGLYGDALTFQAYALGVVVADLRRIATVTASSPSVESAEVA
jgi:hypothetical protein